MFEYSLVGGLPSGNRTVWSRQPLQPVAAGPLTPFSYSILEELLRRAWYQYFDELNFAPMPRARILRQHNGIPYLNLTISAQRDVEQTGLEPMTFVVDGEPFGVAKWEKPGFLSGIKLGRNRKRVTAKVAEYVEAIPAVTQKTQAWYAKTKELYWTQADVLQVMEEIERIGVDSMKIFFAARHNLELLYNQLLWRSNKRTPYPANLVLIDSVLNDLTALVEYQIATDCVKLATTIRRDTATAAWLAERQYTNWEETIPNQQVAKAVRTFFATYGHRAANEAEIAHPRWEMDPELFFYSLHAHVIKQSKLPSAVPSGQSTQRLIDALDGDTKEARQLIEQAHVLMQLQSNALHAFAYLLAGTQQWAHAAAREAMADERLAALDDVFYFTLEEVKQMMTGEWNISDQQGIQRTCQERRQQYKAWQEAAAEETIPWLLIGDNPAHPTHKGVPAAGGEATGPLRRWDTTHPSHCDGAIIGTSHMDSGWSLILPLARALVVAQGSPLDPIVGAARAWHLPTVTTLGPTFASLVNGAQTTVNGGQGAVTQ